MNTSYSLLEVIEPDQQSEISVAIGGQELGRGRPFGWYGPPPPGITPDGQFERLTLFVPDPEDYGICSGRPAPLHAIMGTRPAFFMDGLTPGNLSSGRPPLVLGIAR